MRIKSLIGKALRLAALTAALAAVVAAVVVGLREWRERRDAAERAASPQGRLPAGTRPTRYEVELRIDPRQDRFDGQATVGLALDAATDTIWLHGKDLDVDRATVVTPDGRRIDAEYREMGHSGVARLRPASPVGPGEATLELAWSAEIGRKLVGAYRVDVDDASYVVTQFEAIDARRVLPCFDEPAFKTPFGLALVVPEGDVALANMPAAGEEDAGDGWRRVRFETTPPLPTYLLAFAVGPFDVVDGEPIPANELRSRPVPVRGVAAAGRGAEMGYALRETAAVLERLERYFGSPYPFPKLDLVAVPDFAAGAMENPGLVTYCETYLLLDDEPAPEEQREYGLIHAHELAHMWFGDLVTMAWWDDLWLNEGFATWLENRIAARWRPDLELGREAVRAAHQVMAQDAFVTARQLRQPVTDNHDVESSFDDITYEKGASVLRMFESYLGEERFRAGVRHHLERFPFGTATSEDFLASLAEGAGDTVVTEALPTFLEQPGVPLVEASWSCAAEELVLELRQSRYLPVGSRGSPDAIWSVPVCWRRVGPVGSDGEPRCLLMTEREARVTAGDGCPTAVLPNAGGVGYYRWSVPEAGWSALLDVLPEMTPEEAYSVIDNLAAELRGGRIGVDFYLAAVRRAVDPEVWTLDAWDVILAPRDELLFVAEHLVEDERRPEILATIREIYEPWYRQLGLRDDTELDREDPVSTALLREELVSSLALDARWDQLRAELVEPARTLVESGVSTPEIDPSLAPTALTVAIEELGEPFYRRVMEKVSSSDDPVFRSDALYALGQVSDTELAAEIRGLVLSFTLRINEKARLVLLQMQNPSQREALFDWSRRYFGVMAALMPEDYVAHSPWIAAGFCDRRQLEEVRSFFEPRMEDVSGGPAVLASVLEEIELCVALADFVRADSESR